MRARLRENAKMMKSGEDTDRVHQELFNRGIAIQRTNTALAASAPGVPRVVDVHPFCWLRQRRAN